MDQLTETPTRDAVFLRNLTLSAIIGKDAWQRSERPQPVVIDLKLQTDITVAAAQDTVEHTLNYGTLYKNITGLVEEGEPAMTMGGRKQWGNLRNLAAVLCYIPFRTAQETNGISISLVELSITLPKGVLLAEGGVAMSWVIESSSKTNIEVRDDLQRFFIRQLKIPTIIGVNPHERLEKQQVVIDLTLRDIADHSAIWTEYHEIVRHVTQRVESSSFQTLEALAAVIAKAAFTLTGFDTVTVSVQKPSALTFVAGAGVEFTRTRAQLEPLVH